MTHVTTNTCKYRIIVLGMLVVQNATQTLVMRYSRGVLNEHYHPGSVVLLTEICKLLTCIFIVYCDLGKSVIFNKHNTLDENIINRIIHLIKSSGYTCIPTTCYFIQNSLQYVASENLTSSVYAVLQQMKILSAAIASVIMLNKHLSWNKWRALFLLCCGGLLMEYHTFQMHDQDILQNNNDPVKGTAAILTIAGLSGFAGVCTELLLKNKSIKKTDTLQLSIWDRNMQFASWSVLFGILSLFIDMSWTDTGLFSNWSIVTIILVLLWTLGGLLVAFSIKYTNVIMKGFASAISLIFICINGWLLLSDYLDMIFIIGAIVTIIATFNYNDSNIKTTSKLLNKKDTHDIESLTTIQSANNTAA
eukprot:200671_1